MTLAPVVLAAIAASIVAGGILTGAVALLARARALDAAARHTLWFGALVVIAILPVAGILTSVAQVERRPATTDMARSSAHARTVPALAGHSRSALSNAPVGSGSAHVPAQAKPGPATVGRPTLDVATLRLTLGAVSAGLASLILAGLALGTLVGFAGLLVGLARLRGVKRRSSPLDESLASDLPWLTATKTGRETYLRLSYEIETPVAIGFSRPVILIPTDLATLGGLVGIEDLVVHEHAHLRRYDDYTNLVQRIVERVFWFNPFVWVVGRRIALEREIAADDAVVARTSDSARYAEALWKLARQMRMPAHTLVAPGALFTRKQISVRIEALLAPGRAHLRGLGPATSGAALAVAVLSFAIVALAAPPLELPAVPQAPGLPSQPQNASVTQNLQDASSLRVLSGLIGARLNKEADAIEKPGGSISAERLNEMQTETSLLAAKLVVMKGIADRTNSAKALQRVNALQDQARQVSAELDALARRNATLAAEQAKVAQQVTVPPTKVDVPSVHVNVPARHIVVPEQHVTVPKIDVAVPSTHVLVPAQHIDMPALHIAAPGMQTPVDVPAVHVSVPAVHVDGTKHVALFSDGMPNDISVTRALIAHCTGCDLSGRDLRNLDLHGLTLTGLDLSRADLRGANLSKSNFSGTDLSRAKLDGADLTDAVFSGADIAGASFHGARMDGVQFNGISLAHSSFDGTALRAILVHGCSGCDLSHMDLRGVDLHGVSLSGADFSHSNLSGANLSGAKFSGVSFDNADLERADLRNAQLTGCSLSGTALRGALLDGIRLTGTSLGRDP
jgi:uncharacterized protein YjbI with pentapeptide repeats/beta-lactamase regulating signal transducer with metallopeptidase domain